MIDELKNPASKQDLVDTFKNASNHKLTYFEFFQLITVRLGIKSVAEWVYTDFEFYLDQNDTAYIQLKHLA